MSQIKVDIKRLFIINIVQTNKYFEILSNIIFVINNIANSMFVLTITTWIVPLIRMNINSNSQRNYEVKENVG